MAAGISERCKLGHRAALARGFLAAQYVSGPGSPQSPHPNSSTATKAQGSGSHHPQGSSGSKNYQVYTKYGLHLQLFQWNKNLHMHVCTCRHRLYTDIYLHMNYFYSICIQAIVELKDSTTTGESTKKKKPSKISVAHYAVELIARSRGLAVASSL